MDINIFRRNSRIALILALLVLMSAGQSLVYATPVSEKKARVQEIKTQLDSMDTKIGIADEQYLQAANKLTELKNKVFETRIKLNSSRKTLKSRKKALNRRAKGMYQADSLSLLEIVLSSRNFSDFFESIDFLKMVGEKDAFIIRQVRKAEIELNKAQRELTAATTEQKKTVNTLYMKKKEIESQIEAKKELISGIEEDIKRLEAAQRSAEIRQMQRVSAGPKPVVDNDGMPTNAPKSGVVAIAYAQLGKPYQWGAAGPGSFDCSGLTMYCYAQVGVSLPHSSKAQYGSGRYVSQANLQPGDLVFFGSPIHHVGMYIGSGAMIHAPRSGDVVKIAPAFRGDYVGACRP